MTEHDGTVRGTRVAGAAFLVEEAGDDVPPTSTAAGDAAATRRDAAAEERDLLAVARDRLAREAHDDSDPGFAARYLSAVDRDSAAGDRAEALADRRRAQRERATARAALEVLTQAGRRQGATPAGRSTTPPGGPVSMTGVEDPRARLAAALARQPRVHRAQGMVMAARQVSAEEALRLLLELLDPDGASQLDAARALVEEERDQPTSAAREGRPPDRGRGAETRRTR